MESSIELTEKFQDKTIQVDKNMESSIELTEKVQDKTIQVDKNIKSSIELTEKFQDEAVEVEQQKIEDEIAYKQTLLKKVLNEF